MRSLFSNTWLLVISAIIFSGYSFYYSVASGDPQWFQRSGSIVVLIGVFITARRIVRLGENYLNEDWNLPDESAEGKKALLDQRSESIYGPIVAVIGTIIWGYGDLVFNR